MGLSLADSGFELCKRRQVKLNNKTSSIINASFVKYNEVTLRSKKHRHPVLH